MNAPYYIFPPIKEGDWWGVYGPGGIMAGHRYCARAKALCNELNYEAGRAEGGFLSLRAEREAIRQWRTENPT